jgi:hypothetical protein
VTALNSLLIKKLEYLQSDKERSQSMKEKKLYKKKNNRETESDSDGEKRFRKMEGNNLVERKVRKFEGTVTQNPTGTV